MATVLLVDDLANVRRSAAILLEQDGHVVHEAVNLGRALEVLASTDVDVVVTDVRMEGDADGTALLQTIKSRAGDIEVVMVTAFGTIDDAVGAMKTGAYDYLTKPLDPARLMLTVRRAAERRGLAREVRQLRAQVGGGEEIVGVSRAMHEVHEAVAKLARTDSTVLITGESGTGKELVARALYSQSARRTAKFVPINCGAIPETMLESELFGHRKGAFTGAVSDNKGLLENANRGVLFLDEIGEMPSSMQVRLLRFLEHGEVRRIGDTDARRVDVRLLLATHRSLEEEIAHRRFREDFYYRINVVGIHIPPLRDRPEDIVPLIEYLLPRLATRLRRSIKGLTPGAIDLLTSYSWPGNVRELHNAIERGLNVASGDVITEADLPARVTVSGTCTSESATTVRALDRERLLAALNQHHWNQKNAAASLGVSRTTLWRRLREFQIES
jgi:DNA-binding NtrC family response regulator